MALGEQIRSFRLRRGVTATELARRAAVSTSLISQVERGTSSPSVDVLKRIAEALDIHIGDLFDGPERNGMPAAPDPSSAIAPPRGARVVRSDARKAISLPRSHVRYELLSPDLQGRLEFILIRYEPGEAGEPAVFSHEGEESIHVLTGTARFFIADEEFVLDAGDTVTFDSAAPHRLTNAGVVPLVAISAGTPPSF